MSCVVKTMPAVLEHHQLREELACHNLNEQMHHKFLLQTRSDNLKFNIVGLSEKKVSKKYK